jgi:peptidoglycan/xylan/chitin deacetylase (PgdA/CDA1 family)
VNDPLILCYHAVSRDWPTEFAIAPSRLEAQLRMLLERGYRPTTLTAATEARGSGKQLVVSFDDACRSVLKEAVPVLAALGVPATVFVPTAYATSQEPMAWAGMAQWLGTPFERELDCMDWDEIRGLAERGWEIGSHSSTHRDLSTLDDAELDVELIRSRAEIEERLDRPCAAFAYPYSAYDDRVKGRTRAAGYSTGSILDNEIAIAADGDRFELLRSGIYRGDGRGRFLAKTSPTARRLRESKPVRLAMQVASRRVRGTR